MKEEIFKILVICLLCIIIVIQLTEKDIGRYKLNSPDAYVFDTKTGKVHSAKSGTLDILNMSNKEDEKREKNQDSI